MPSRKGTTLPKERKESKARKACPPFLAALTRATLGGSFVHGVLLKTHNLPIGAVAHAMISLTSTQNGSLTLNVKVNGPVIYLDTWAFIELAKKNPSRRKRFVDALRRG